MGKVSLSPGSNRRCLPDVKDFDVVGRLVTAHDSDEWGVRTPRHAVDHAQLHVLFVDTGRFALGDVPHLEGLVGAAGDEAAGALGREDQAVDPFGVGLKGPHSLVVVPGVEHLHHPAVGRHLRNTNIGYRLWIPDTGYRIPVVSQC